MHLPKPTMAWRHVGASSSLPMLQWLHIGLLPNPLGGATEAREEIRGILFVSHSLLDTA